MRQLFSTLSPDLMQRRLAHPGRPVSLVLDTDTYNEVDDQFALAWATRSPEAMTLEAIHAAPFHNTRSDGPADGMEKSHAEILRVLGRLGESPDGRVFRGSTRYLPSPDAPVESAAARDLVARAMARSSDDPPLYVVAIGGPTNVASAMLMEPRIIERIVVLWLGGHARTFPANAEFNLRQDLPASQLLFDSGVPLVWFPCEGVASHLATTVPELERDLAGRSAIGDYLVEIVQGYGNDHFAWAKVIWDVAPIASLVNERWTPSRLVPSPILDDEMRWQEDATRHAIREVVHVNRNAIFRDLFTKLGR